MEGPTCPPVVEVMPSVPPCIPFSFLVTRRTKVWTLYKGPDDDDDDPEVKDGRGRVGGVDTDGGANTRSVSMSTPSS